MSSRTRLTIFSALATLLASAALGAVFDQLSWLLPVLGVIAIVAGIGELGRRFGLPAFLGPVLAAVGVLGYVTAVFAGEPAIGRLLPGPAALASLREQVTQGFSDIRVYAAPVPTHPGMVLITVVGVAAVALVVDLLAVTLRRASLAGLPLLALFAVPAAVVPKGVGVLPFVLGGIGYLALLLAEGRDRIGRWGRQLGGRRAANAPTAYAFEFADSSPLATVGRRIGVAALGVAVVIPALVPGLHPGLFGGSGGSGLRTSGGSDTVATYDPIARLKPYLLAKDHKELIRVTTNDPNPDYLRMVGLDVFDGTKWSESPLSVSKETRISKGRLPAPEGLSADTDTTPAESRIKVGDLDVHWLPVPYPATNVKVKNWNFDKATATIFSTRSSAKRTSYTVVSAKVTPDPDQLRRAPAAGPRLEPFRARPALPAKIERQVATIIAGKPDDYSKALAIQGFFRTGFKYDVTAPAGNGVPALETFLTAKAGYCEQFAAAMAIFAREAKIPARVAIGFTRGERQGDGSWRITTADAHAWPELYFEGAGWLRFEPTPLGEGRAVLPTYTNDAGGTGAGVQFPTGGPTTAPESSSGLGAKLERLESGAGPVPPVDLKVAKSTDSGPPLTLLLLGLLALALMVAPALGRAAIRRRRWSRASTPVERAHAAWAELRDDAGDFGHAWPASDSPRAAGTRLIRGARLGNTAADAVGLLIRAEERARYSRTPADARELRGAVARVRMELFGRAPRGRRWLARLVPRSSLTLAGAAVAAAMDAMDAADALGARLRGRLLRRSPA
jgi:transglutaminase-like putative cysteine protease